MKGGNCWRSPCVSLAAVLAAATGGLAVSFYSYGRGVSQGIFFVSSFDVLELLFF